MRSGDISQAAADLLQAEKRKLNESQAQFQAEFEAREAMFNAELETIAPHKRNTSTRQEPDGY